jgi:hypothetical protein
MSRNDQRRHTRRSRLSRYVAAIAFVTLALAFAGTVVEQILGALLVFVALADVFLTVLYARMGAGLVGIELAHATWGIFRFFSRPFGARRSLILSFAGPSILVLLLLTWAMMLMTGAAMMIHPALGTSLRASSGPTPTDFITALFTAGNSLSGSSSEVRPAGGGFRLLFIFDALVPTSALSLTLTYLLQVYTALQRRNTLGAKVHELTSETGDAAEMVAALGPQGRFETGHAQLADVASELNSVKESHHLYPVLFYFRFPEPQYSVSRVTLIGLDAVTLIKSALDDREYAWLQESAAVDQLARASLRLVTSLERTFLGGAASEVDADPGTVSRWRLRYSAALRRLREAGIKTRADEREGADLYVSMRAKWDGHIRMLAPAGAYSMLEIDPAGCIPEATLVREPFATRQKTFA